MKYIRTKDGRILDLNRIKHCAESYSFNNESETHLSIEWDIIREEVDIIKQADTIEELCDEFLFVDKLFPENDGRGKIRMRSLPKALKKIDYLKRKLKDYFREEEYVVYGVIWVNDELHKVAKMNEGGKLCLL